MGSTGRRWLAAAALAAVVTALAAQAQAARDGVAEASVTPVARAVELMKALEAHRYAAACDVYDPVFWEMVGYLSRDCAKVLRETFPRQDPVAYKIEFGGLIGPRMAVVIVSMALGETALSCHGAWQEARFCPGSSAYYLQLVQKTLLTDWRGRRVADPQSRWYVTSVGDV